MISLAEHNVGTDNAPIYQLRIALLYIDPPVWRTIQVPGNARLDWLHAAIQVAFGWTNSHLHQFKVNDDCYSDTNVHYAEFEGDPEILEETKFTLQHIAPKEQSAFGYEYDFGDSWMHSVLVEKILPPNDKGSTSAVCLDGARACPPEDCGGVSGYAELIEVFKNKKHPEHKHMKKWLGRMLEPEAFDIKKTNTWLRKLKWPRVTESALRKILMARDGYKE